MTGDPLVSIRCTVYNHEPFLRQCLDGFVMQQTSFPFEAIVHDDASTDGSAAIIREYAEKYPDIIKPIYETENQYSKHDGSIGRIMDAAIHPSAKYIATCEGDDYWTDPEKLQLQVDFLENHPDYTMCFHRAKTILDETGEETDRFPSESFKMIEDRDYTSTEMLQQWTVPTASMVYQRKCASFTLNFRYFILYGDIVKVLMCAEMGKVRGLGRTMSVYRIHDNSILHDKNSEQRLIQNSPEHYLFLKDNFTKVDSKVIDYFISKRFWIRALNSRNKKDAIRDIVQSFRYDRYRTIYRITERNMPFILRILHKIKH